MPAPKQPDRTPSAWRVTVLAEVFQLQDKAIKRAAARLPAGQRPPVIGREVSVAEPLAALCRAATQADLLVLGSDRNDGLAADSLAGRIAAQLTLRRRRRTSPPLIVIATPQDAGADLPVVTIPTLDAPTPHVPTSQRPLTRRIGHRPAPGSKVPVNR